MATEHDGRTTGSGAAFGFGLLAGAIIGVGLGLLFAPKGGAALRRDISRRARDIRDEANEHYDRVTEAAGELADRGRDVAQRARTAVTTGIREARRYASDVVDAAADGLGR
jgi:gas vesicle protein